VPPAPAAVTRPAGRARRAALAAAAAAVLVLGGCAEREVVAAPAEPPGTGTWVAVWVAGLLAAALWALHLTRPCWPRPAGSRLATAVLALQAGAATVVGAGLVGYALRCWQLVDRPLDEPPATALVRISRIDGDGDLFALFVLAIVLLGGLLVAVLALAARMAAGTDRLERCLVVGLLGVEIAGATTLAVLHVAGFGGWPFRSGLLALPVLVAAFAAAWPRNLDPRDERAEPDEPTPPA